MNRLTTGLTAAIIWGGILYTHSYTLMWFFVFIISLIGLFEYFRICLPRYSSLTRLITVSICSLPVLSTYQGSTKFLLPSLLFSLLCITVFSFVLTQPDNTKKDTFISKTASGLLFIGLCASHVPLLVTLEDGILWLGLLTIITIASDTGAYYTGTNFGKHKLCPTMSPGKTIEGLIGGIVCSVLFSWVYKVLFLQNQTTFKIILLTIAICLIGVCGDLTESIVKRANNTKDSGDLLPGHGGMLDRIDSILAAAPALYYSVSLGFMY